jgi:hypothetical protein
MMESPLAMVVTGRVRAHHGPVEVVSRTESLGLIRIPEPTRN